MKRLNCIVVFNRDKGGILFCNRTKDPYKGMYNFVGGKVEPGESSSDAAYRELYEETGVGRAQIRLHHFMDITYYYQDFVLELYTGILREDVVLKEEVNPLIWLSLQEDFTDPGKFAGEQNIAHIINVALKYPLRQEETMMQDGLYIGVDGCRNGWIAAVLQGGDLRIERFDTIDALVEKYPDFDSFLIDMAIGLVDDSNQVRPDLQARLELGDKKSSVFPVPAREAVYAEGEDTQKQTNIRMLGKILAKQSIAIIPKIREIDKFLQKHSKYKNRILESHPEVAFSRLNGAIVRSSKKDIVGFTEREQILTDYLGRENLTGLWNRAKELRCNPDDVMDAACLAVTAALHAHGMCESIPAEPEMDRTGLLMKMTVPRK